MTTPEAIDLAALRMVCERIKALEHVSLTEWTNLASPRTVLALLDYIESAALVVSIARHINSGMYEDSRMTAALERHDRAIAGQQQRRPEGT